MNRIPIVIDCDPGVDDALAIILANAKECFEIKAITSVAGNVELVYTTKNLQILASLLDLKCPIAAGADRPLVKLPVTASKTHGSDGFGGHAHLLAHLPLRELSELSAVKLLAKVLAESAEPITVVAVGPLTNIAILIKAYPELLPKIKQFSIMGGGIKYGNITPTAEFNFYVDPEAAQIVFSSGIPIILAGLDATLQAHILPEDIKLFEQIDNPVAEIATKILAAYAGHDSALHDPVSLLALSNPEIFEFKALYLQVETNEGATRAMSFADNRSWKTNAKNVSFISKVNRPAFIEQIKQALQFYNSKAV